MPNIILTETTMSAIIGTGRNYTGICSCNMTKTYFTNRFVSPD